MENVKLTFQDPSPANYLTIALHMCEGCMLQLTGSEIQRVFSTVCPQYTTAGVSASQTALAVCLIFVLEVPQQGVSQQLTHGPCAKSDITSINYYQF